MHARVAQTAPCAETGRTPSRRLHAVTVAALVLTLVVVAASAYIRFAEAGGVAPLGLARAIHRLSATLAALAVIAGVVLAWRSRDARARTLSLVALALTLSLSAIGIAWGMTPPPLARAGNLLGGLALVAVLAALLGHGARTPLPAQAARRVRLALGLGVSQMLLGAWLAAHPGAGPDAALLAHVLLGLATAALAVGAAVRLLAAGERQGALLGVAAGCAVLAGAASAVFELPAGLALLHPVSVAVLLAGLAGAAARTP